MLSTKKSDGKFKLLMDPEPADKSEGPVLDLRPIRGNCMLIISSSSMQKASATVKLFGVKKVKEEKGGKLTALDSKEIQKYVLSKGKDSIQEFNLNVSRIDYPYMYLWADSEGASKAVIGASLVQSS